MPGWSVNRKMVKKPEFEENQRSSKCPVWLFMGPYSLYISAQHQVWSIYTPQQPFIGCFLRYVAPSVCGHGNHYIAFIGTIFYCFASLIIQSNQAVPAAFTSTTSCLKPTNMLLKCPKSGPAPPRQGMSQNFLFRAAKPFQWIAIVYSIRMVYSNPLPTAVLQKKRTAGIAEPIGDITNN